MTPAEINPFQPTDPTVAECEVCDAAVGHPCRNVVSNVELQHVVAHLARLSAATDIKR